MTVLFKNLSTDLPSWLMTGKGEKKRESLAKGSSLLMADKGGLLAASLPCLRRQRVAALASGGADRYNVQ